MNIRPLTTEASANGSSNASTFGRSMHVRAVNTAASASLVTLVDSDGSTLGTMSLAASESVILHKPKNHKYFAANASVLFAGVDYRG